ncbi:MAG: flagellar biosynthesis protein FlhF [Desulfovibrionales bacterium]|nr:flagellar biosynthesis protein FlhF [Desulfovibrionales bacterium]
MKIKRYEARDINAAVQMVKSELGPEAIILSTKRLRKGSGLLGGTGKSMVEVVAAIDYEPREPMVNTAFLPEKRSADYLPGPVNNKLITSQLPEVSALRAEVAGLKRMIQTAVGPRPEMRHGGQAGLSAVPAQAGGPLNQAVDTLTAYLESIGLESALVCSLLEGAGLDGRADPAESSARLRDIITGRLLDQIVLGRWDEEKANRPCVWAFIGPTGVGKTTTCAKLAAHFALKEKKRVALISADNYRIAASEQLKTYAQILGVPFMAVFKDQDLSRAINRNQDKDIILIDTAGRSPHHEEHMQEMARYIYAHPAIEGQLVVSATTQNGVIEDILAKYLALSVTGCIFSKIDESRFYGPIFNQAVRFKSPIFYFTTGQRVPEDIETATRKRLIDLLWSELHEGV